MVGLVTGGGYSLRRGVGYGVALLPAARLLEAVRASQGMLADDRSAAVVLVRGTGSATLRFAVVAPHT